MAQNIKENSWVVHKFGGTSVANAERYKAVAEIVINEKLASKKAIVVSAMSKVTDALIDLVKTAQLRDDAYLTKLHSLKQKHLEALAGLQVESSLERSLQDVFNSNFKDIEELLRGVSLSRSFSETTLELISGYGEIWSAQLLNSHLKTRKLKSKWLDAREVLVVSPQQNSSPFIEWELSQPKMDSYLKANAQDIDYLVITGFVASYKDGISTTLKRNGSDFSASIFGALLKAESICIWTDVDGVLSADPRLVPDAVVLDELSYNEATELAYFGAKVVHPSTMAPAIKDRIPIYIRNTFNPSFHGTKIHEENSEKNFQLPVKGFATINDVALVNVEGTGMIGVPGVAQRLFGALKEVGVSVIMISQASSEQSICFVVHKAQAQLAKDIVEKTFFSEIHHHQIQKVSVLEDSAVIAAVGDNMVDSPGVAGRFFNALGKSSVNIRAIAQGSSERNISAVVATADINRALRAVHSAFYLSNQTISIGVIGPGLIGSTFIKQLVQEQEKLKKEYKIDLRLRGIINSKSMLLSEEAINSQDWQKTLADQKTKADIEQFLSHIQASHLPHSVLIDCTSHTSISERYADWLSRGLHIITPNKKANSAEVSYYKKLKSIAQSKQRHYLYETTVGAGLPILNTLRELVLTGDKIISIEGILSGTLAYIFNAYNLQKSFSDVVKEAKSLGYTEPDPRDDLSGTDVARKVVILAREAGRSLDLKDIAVENLVPANLLKCPTDEFMQRLSELDTPMNNKLLEANKNNQVLRYVGALSETGQATVGLKSYPKEHPFARIQGSDNIVAFTTQRYSKQPLIIQGPGAGPEVTAAGVFADLLRLASFLGAS